MKYLRRYKLFESTVDDITDSKLCARSKEWCLYRFDDIYDFMDFENSIGERGSLTSGPFSVPKDASQDKIDTRSSMFNQYKDRSGNFYLLIDRNMKRGRGRKDFTIHV